MNQDILDTIYLYWSLAKELRENTRQGIVFRDLFFTLQRCGCDHQVMELAMCQPQCLRDDHWYGKNWPIVSAIRSLCERCPESLIETAKQTTYSYFDLVREIKAEVAKSDTW